MSSRRGSGAEGGMFERKGIFVELVIESRGINLDKVKKASLERLVLGGE